MKIRLKFTKVGPVQYVGHLDFLRFFQKAMRRSGLPASYSKGFHPHMLMSFASPLGIGMESLGDYVDIYLDKAVSRGELLEKLNSQLTEGVTVTDACVVGEEKKDNAMAMVRYADYQVQLPWQELVCDKNELTARIEALLAAEQLMILQQSKKQERERDLRPHIHDLQLVETEAGSALQLRLSCGSADNVKPEAILQLLDLQIQYPKVLRLDMMTDGFRSLADTGQREF